MTWQWPARKRTATHSCTRERATAQNKHTTTRALFHSFILSFFHSFILSFFHSFILSFFHSFILSFFQQLHSTLARRARTSEARVTPHGCTQERLFSSVWCFCPRLLRLLALVCFVGTRPSRYDETTGDTRTFPSVSCVVWESACGSSLDDGYANVSAFACKEVTRDLVAVRQWHNS